MVYRMKLGQMKRVSMNQDPLVGLLLCIHGRLEQGDIEGAKDSILTLIRDIEGWGEE